MKVCILSMQKVDNFGSLLQSYALKKLIEYQGHDVGFIDIEIHEEDNQLLQGYKNEYESEKEITTKNVFLTKIKRVDKYFLNRIHIRKLHNRQKDILEQFRKEQLNIGKNNNAKYDVCVIGSDEVFNCMEDSEWGFTSQLFGNVKQAKRVITYAASCGMTTYDRVPDCAKEKIKESVKNIERFSVRDKNTRKFLERLSVENIYMHYDPVVIGDFSKEIMSAPETKNIPNKYCIIYSYYNRIHDPIEIKAITKFCKKNKIEPVTIGTPQKWVKKHLVVSPFEALKLFSHADFVITDTFHGTIFSAKYANKFAVLIRKSNYNKLADLVEKLGIEAHVLKNIYEIDNIYKNVESDKERINQIVLENRKETNKYLKEAI